MDGEEQGPAPQQTIYSLPDNSAYNRWVQDFSKEISAMENELRGLRVVGIDDEGNQITEQVSQPYMNERGILWFSSKLRKHCNKNTYISMIDEKRMYDLLKTTMYAYTDTLLLEHENYEVSAHHFREIIADLRLLLEMAFRRALNEGERKHIMPTERTTRTIMVDEGQKKSGGLFQNILGGRK